MEQRKAAPIAVIWTDLEIAFERNAPDVQSYPGPDCSAS